MSVFFMHTFLMFMLLCICKHTVAMDEKNMVSKMGNTLVPTYRSASAAPFIEPDLSAIITEVFCTHSASLSYILVETLASVNRASRRKILAETQIDQRFAKLKHALQQYDHISVTPPNMVYNDLGACGWVQDICTECFRDNACDCNKSKYPGMLCRAQLNGTENVEIYKAYLPSKYLNSFIIPYKKIQQCNHIVQVSHATHLPNAVITVPSGSYKRNHMTYDAYQEQEKKPYSRDDPKHRAHDAYTCVHHGPYFDDKNNLCLLNSIPARIKDTCNFDKVNECSLTKGNRCTYTPCFVELDKRCYPLGFLCHFPFFLASCIKNSMKHREVERIVLRSTKCITDSDRGYNNDINETLANILSAIKEVELDKQQPTRWFPLSPNNLKGYYEANKISYADHLVLKVALCAKLGGNNTAAYTYLRDYDIRTIKCLDGIKARLPIGVSSLNQVFGLQKKGYAQLEPNYEEIVQALHSAADIDPLLEKIKRNRTHLFLINPTTLVEIQKHEEKYCAYLWKVISNWYMRWDVHKEGELINCTGTIVGTHTLTPTLIEKLRGDKLTGTLSVTEERTQLDGTVVLYEHILNPNYAIDASQVPHPPINTKSIETTPTQVHTPPHTPVPEQSTLKELPLMPINIEKTAPSTTNTTRITLIKSPPPSASFWSPCTLYYWFTSLVNAVPSCWSLIKAFRELA
jgi:hypothetical protein